MISLLKSFLLIVWQPASFTIFTLILASCSPNDKETRLASSDTVEIDNPVYDLNVFPIDSLKKYAYKVRVPDSKAPNGFYKETVDLPKKWIGLSKNELGFFIYHRGKNYYDYLEILDDTLFFGGYGENVNWPIRYFRTAGANSYYFGLGGDLDTTSSTYARARLNIIEFDTLYSILTTQVFKLSDSIESLIMEYEGLYVPKENEQLFRQIDEPNTKTPDAWVPQHEIDMVRLKSRFFKKPLSH